MTIHHSTANEQIQKLMVSVRFSNARIVNYRFISPSWSKMDEMYCQQSEKMVVLLNSAIYS